MLEQIFSKGQQPYTQSPVTNVLEDFANWLVDEGYEGTALRRHLFRLKQTLEGADDVTAESRFSPEEVRATTSAQAALTHDSRKSTPR